ncbi:MAG: T9SS type A sorting domain-containing protein, partial [Fluviicola sp.]
VSIAIYDMMGKLIQVLAKDETVSTTNQVFEWNGLDASSNLVSNGTYQVSILLNGEMKNAKIIKQ